MQTADQRTSGPVEWMTLEASAKLLNKSPRTLLQWVKDAKITGKRERDPSKRGQETTFLHAGEVAALAEQIDAAKNEGAALVRRPASALPALQTSIGPAQPVATPITSPWLTIDEAAKGFGISKRRLVVLANSGLYPRTFRDLGVGSRGGQWRVLLNGKPEGELF